MIRYHLVNLDTVNIKLIKTLKLTVNRIQNDTYRHIQVLKVYSEPPTRLSY